MMAEGEGAYGRKTPLALRPEDYPFFEPPVPQFIVAYDIPVKDKKLTWDEASRCLNTLGRDETGARYAYLMITATDKKLTDISIVLSFKHVLFLDFSGNFLTMEALQVLSQMPFLILLKADRNRIESGALGEMPYLQVLSLNINKVEETYDIAQPMLETLNLEFNQIFTAQFESERLPHLKELDLKGNHLMDISGMYPEHLERLFAAQNKITRISGLAMSKLTNLTTLHLRDNKIKKLNGFSEYFTKLEYLNVRNNNITKLRQFRKLACLPNLRTLIITGNPVRGKQRFDTVKGEGGAEEDEDDPQEEAFGEDGPVRRMDPVRVGLLVLLPNLTRIDKDLVTLEEREEALMTKDKQMELIMGEISSDEETEPPTTTYTSEVGGESETDFEDEKPVEIFNPSNTEEEDDD
ncbi:leucine-rich repeat-containing protein 23-like [Sitophilus oryzae]|uniref:Leucine-rich repeat-containing protein 23-like n=1 Tax=Sitophilus oryzae TaxID=7048 RepID=A0A6J2YKM9_SITOR|nr:leucine-rich repeat-containing protein 23-like [Sitophilus oryzae]